MDINQEIILKFLEGKFLYLIPRNKHHINEMIRVEHYIKHNVSEVIYQAYNVTYNENNNGFFMGTQAAFVLIKTGKVYFEEPDVTLSIEIME